MDNYIGHFLSEHPMLAPEIKARLRHFQYQYLAKVSNICLEDAHLFGQNLSPWNTAGRGDYQRFYHLNPLLQEIEAEIAPSVRAPFFLISDKNLVPTQLNLATIQGQDLILLSDTGDRAAIHEFIVERGLTPTLQQAAKMAAQLRLCQPNPTYDFPPQKSSYSGQLVRFKEAGKKSFPIAALADLLEGFAHLGLDAWFKKNGLTKLLEDSRARVLYWIEEALASSGSRQESYLDLLYEEMLLWLIVMEPYPESALEASIQKAISPPALLRVHSTGMAAFSEVLRCALDPDSTVLLFDGCYFENRAALLKSHPADSIYLVRSPDYEVSFAENIKKMKKVDFLFINFHENILKGRTFSKKNEIGAYLEKLRDLASPTFTVVIDTTIGYLDSEEVRDLLDRFNFNFILLWSHQKFDLLGTDKLSGGTFSIYSRDQTFLSRFNHPGSIDSASRQGLSHHFAFAAQKLEERREIIFSNAQYANERIEIGSAVKKEDPVNFSIDVQCDWDLELPICKAFVEKGIPLMTRSGFGYNLTTAAFTRFHMVRFSLGLESKPELDRFITAFNEIFPKLKNSVL
ncbi:MAG: hypothetical protein JSS32_06420 [Verrucomicrobia bacterium]|nr:hypothetical protein [Verrucomicrobiota bacterium]